MKIYTKTGDEGKTGLFGGTRVPKHHIRIESYGTIDELNSHIGLLRDQEMNAHHKEVLTTIQNKLFTIGAILATDPEKVLLKSGKERLDIERIEESDVTFLEQEMDAMDSELPPMTHFILPGGHQTVSICHITRCICRRAERLTTALHDISPVESIIMAYLNRLSDYFFVLARKLTLDLRVEETPWIPQKKS